MKIVGIDTKIGQACIGIGKMTQPEIKMEQDFFMQTHIRAYAHTIRKEKTPPLMNGWCRKVMRS